MYTKKSGLSTLDLVMTFTGYTVNPVCCSLPFVFVCERVCVWMQIFWKHKHSYLSEDCKQYHVYTRIVVNGNLSTHFNTRVRKKSIRVMLRQHILFFIFLLFFYEGKKVAVSFKQAPLMTIILFDLQV